MIYSFIKNNEQVFPIEKMCKVLKVNSGSYYRWKKQIISARLQRKIATKEEITSVYFKSKQRYGSPRITLELQSLGYKISRITVFKIYERIRLAKQIKQEIQGNNQF